MVGKSWPQMGDRVHFVPGLGGCQDSAIAEFKSGDGVYAKVTPGPDEFVSRDERYAQPPSVWDDDLSGYRSGTWHLASQCKVPDTELYEGTVALRWGVPAGAGSPGHPLLGALLTVTDVLTGASITTVTEAEIHAPVRGVVTTHLTMLTGTDGRPLAEGQPVTLNENGDVRMGVFRFIVAEMQTIRPGGG